jgi:hypothetical protein
MPKYKVEAQFMIDAENPLRAAEAAAEFMDDPMIMTLKVTNQELPDDPTESRMVDLDCELHDERCAEEDLES